MLHVEFDRQVENLVKIGYPKVAGVKTKDFIQHIEPLKKRIGILPALKKKAGAGCVAFVIVIKKDLVASEKAMPLVNLAGANGFVGMYPVEVESFKPIDGVTIPNGPAYLVADIDAGKETLNVTPDDALKTIRRSSRSPLTIDEGIALVTHFPEILRNSNCFSMLGSRRGDRRGDRRVTAIWISRGKPRLGWCWAGNPHTWLGAASCSSRIGR